ncbi:MAG: lipoyl synthase [Acidimicrobiales bacterium]
MLHVRWLGTVRYRDALALQHGLFEHGSPDSHLLLLEHPHVYTLGVRAELTNLLVAPADVGAELVHADRGGDITYHGPGQLVGYPILDVPSKRGGGMADTAAYVRGVEQLVIEALADLGLQGVGRIAHPGVWVEPEGARPRKIAAVGVRLARGRSMHGFALNVDPDMDMFEHIVPCGIADKGVTSLAAEGVAVSMREVVDAVSARATSRWGGHGTTRSDVVWRERPEDLSPFSRGDGAGPALTRLMTRRAEAGVTEAVVIAKPKPDWVKTRLRLGDAVLRTKRTVRAAGLVTVCEEAGCPNLTECWSEGTATFMVNGERCTRACGFCLIDTRHPGPPDPGEPERVADAVASMGLRFAVITTVARDDLSDEGASQIVRTIEAVRSRCPGTGVEVLISDCRGEPVALESIFAAAPDVLNHNLETVARLQRAVRPSASYARSLAVLARAKHAGLTTKSGLMVGLGETVGELRAALADLRAVGVDIVTIGHYLQPTANHLPVARWWTPDELTALKAYGEGLGIAHIEATPLTRSSHHAGSAFAAARAEPEGAVAIASPQRRPAALMAR